MLIIQQIEDLKEQIAEIETTFNDTFDLSNSDRISRNEAKQKMKDVLSAIDSLNSSIEDMVEIATNMARCHFYRKRARKPNDPEMR